MHLHTHAHTHTHTYTVTHCDMINMAMVLGGSIGVLVIVMQPQFVLTL